MAKYNLIADVRAYITVEAEDEDEAREIAEMMPFSEWLLDDGIAEIWDITEDT
jgi:hypothetical protein